MTKRNKRTAWVKAGDVWIDIDKTDFIDIEEGPFGDEYVFCLPGSEELHRSNIVFGSKPG